MGLRNETALAAHLLTHVVHNNGRLPSGLILRSDAGSGKRTVKELVNGDLDVGELRLDDSQSAQQAWAKRLGYARCAKGQPPRAAVVISDVL
eukprot:scaffold952_cov409-Prasinococcus_capsulatus_cf.AAC.2